MSALDTVIGIEGIDAGYGQMQILHGVSADVRRGQIVALIGPNGAGKSTVLKTVLGLLRPSKGRVLYHDQDITRTPTHKIIDMGMAYVPQGRIVFPAMTILENLEVGGFTSRDRQVYQHSLERCFELFPLLADQRKQLAGTLSGGQQQMLAIGRAIMSNPDTIILDEPSLGLSPKFVTIVFEALQKMGDQGLTLLAVEQNATKALALADYAYVLEVGRNRFEGRGADLLENAEVRQLYLGG